MGRMAIIVVLGLSLTVGIVGYSLNQAKSGTIENVAGFHKYTTARNIAHSAINMSLRALDRNDSAFINNQYMEMEFMGGWAAVQLTYPVSSIDTLDLTATSRFMDSTRLMRVRLHRRPVPFPVVRQAVGLRIDGPGFEMSGSPSIDGHDHRMNGSPLPPSANDVPGLGVMNPADTTLILPDSNMIDGSPDDIVGDTAIANPLGYIDEYINAADRVYTTGTYGSNMIWGSAKAPEIVYCNGEVTFGGRVDGYGILVITGRLTLTGTFKFRGLIMAYNDAEIDVSFSTGTADIIGGLIAAGGEGSDFTMRGNCDIMYSTEALNMAMYINKLQVYRVLRWYE